MKEAVCKRLSILLVILFVLLTGCKENPGNAEKERDLDFTVVKETDLPAELKVAIEEKKENGFKLTFSEGDYLYIVIGYGKQDTGGYSIVVNDLYLTANGIWFDTELFGPKNGEIVEESPSYPFIVVKIEYMDKNVIFD